MAVQPAAIGGQEDRSFGPLADGQVDSPGGARGQRDGDHLAALTRDYQRPVAALDAKCFDVGTGSFGHPQPVEGEQRDQRMLRRRAKTSRDQQGAELVTVKASGMGLIVQARPPHVRGRRVIEEFFFDGVAVEPGDRA
ncbi:MAG TPA: hypothetical protein DHU96_28225 [Actinobacteria bacterium]|nr:hypothetical protein [Actinomycetota bacterium]